MRHVNFFRSPMPPKNREKPKQTRTRVSDKLRKEIILYHQKNRSKSHSDIAEFFNGRDGITLVRSTITKILQEKEKWLAAAATNSGVIVRHRQVLFPAIEKAMQLWISQALSQGIPLSDMILKEKALSFAQSFDIGDALTFSNGWLSKFKKRHSLRRIICHGEANSAPLESLSTERQKLKKLLSDYNIEDIFNADETSLFFRMEPTQTIATGPMAGKKKVYIILFIDSRFVFPYKFIYYPKIG